MSFSLLTLSVVFASLLAFGIQAQDTCLGEFQLCSSKDCAMSPKDCGKCSSGQYVCPISKQCAANVNEYTACPGLKGTHLDTALTLAQRVQFLLNNLTLDEKYPQLTNSAPEILRLGIPYYNWLDDDEHGVRSSHAVQFADGCGLGATWSKKDLLDAGNIVGLEARSLHNAMVHTGDRGQGQNGATITLYAPNMNLVRDPRWGRAQEVYSEDPRLSGYLTEGYVRGCQFGGAQNDKYYLTVACCKHYAAYDLESQPQSRMTFNAKVNAVNWAETYSPVFHQCIVPAQGQSVMCSYNSINGIPACGNNMTQNNVLRDQWGFEGFVVSDYDAMENIYSTHHYASNSEQAVAIALKAGCDQEGGGTSAINQIPKAISDGLLSISDVDKAVGRLFRARVTLGFFDPPTAVEYNQLTNDSSVEGPEHLNVSRRISGHAMTLYKNGMNGKAVLPLVPSAVTGIAVIGPQGLATNLLLGNYATYPDKGIPTIMEALRAGMKENTTAQCTFLQNTDYYQSGSISIPTYNPTECCSLCFEDDQCKYWTFYQGACYLKETDQGRTNSNGRTSGQCLNNPTMSKVHNQMGCADVPCSSTSGFAAAMNLLQSMHSKNALSAVFVGLGLDQSIEREGRDRSTIELPGNQNALVTMVSNFTAPLRIPLICFLVHGGTLALGAAAYECDAIVDAWYPGQTGAYGFADVVFGAVNPAGRASVTSYKSTSDLPTPGDMNEYGGRGVTYRYFSGEPLYPFGFGLSYTTFTYSNLRMNASADNGHGADFMVSDGCAVIQVTVTVQNTGAVAGDEVVQMYVQQPNAAQPVPNVRLADFERVSIGAGRSVDVTLLLTPRYHSTVFDQNSDAWWTPDIRIEQGVFDVSVGGGQPKYYAGSLSATVYVGAEATFNACPQQD